MRGRWHQGQHRAVQGLAATPKFFPDRFFWDPGLHCVAGRESDLRGCRVRNSGRSTVERCALCPEERDFRRFLDSQLEACSPVHECGIGSQHSHPPAQCSTHDYVKSMRHGQRSCRKGENRRRSYCEWPGRRWRRFMSRNYSHECCTLNLRGQLECQIHARHPFALGRKPTAHPNTRAAQDRSEPDERTK